MLNVIKKKLGIQCYYEICLQYSTEGNYYKITENEIINNMVFEFEV